MTAKGKQAQEEFAFGRQPCPIAVSTKRLGHTADDADFSERRIGLTQGIGIAPTLRCLARARRFQRHQRQLGLNQFDHFTRWQHFVHAPAVGVPHIHVLDEAQHHASAPEVPRHRQNFMRVGAAFDDHIDLDRAQPGSVRCLYALQHVGHRKVHIVHASKHRIVKSVQADCHALQARRLE